VQTAAAATGEHDFRDDALPVEVVYVRDSDGAVAAVF
jgi:hypothetical protein